VDVASLLRQELVYWAPAGNDGFGKTLFAVGVLLACRWQNTQGLFRDASGRQSTSDAIVYTDTPLAIGGYVALGSTGEGMEADHIRFAAYEVRSSGASPSLSGDEVLFKGIL
jgi:hypothetical protein